MRLSALLMLLACTMAWGQVVDPTTLNGKVLAGYQGWFSAPGDGSASSVGWRHWSHSHTDVAPGLYNVDLWPDVSEYDPEELFPAPNVQLTGGGTGWLFSSRTLKTAQRHFRWMKDAGIDGVYLQRFIPAFGSAFFEVHNAVLQNIAAAADLHGRTFALEYDISNQNTEDLFNKLTTDWQYLIDNYQITSHPRYLHHNGKPVVAIWGLGFSDRPGTPDLANQIIDFFRSDPTYGGNYLVGGVPEGWRTLTGASFTDPAWAPVYRRWDVISPWTVGRYRDSGGVTSFKTNNVVPDLQECNSRGIGYLQVFFPGFSWDNEQSLPPGTSNIPRNGGQFFWDQANTFQSAGLTMMKVAMFDEMDEGTAILKISDYPPVTDHWVTYQGYPHDWYMRLAGAATRMLRGEIPLSSTIPIDPHCNGDQVSINLGEDQADRMSHPRGGDGDTIIATAIGGKTCRGNAVASDDHYFYFDIDNGFAYQGNQPDVCITIDYYDTGSGTLTLHYDSNTGSDTPAKYKSGGSVTLSNSNKWKRKIFLVTDAYFGNRQNNGADFRIARSGNNSFYLDRVLVGSPAWAKPVFQVSATAFDHSIQAGRYVANDSFTVTGISGAALNYTVSTAASWLAVTPAAGTSTGESDVITLAYGMPGLPSGDYTAVVTVADTAAGGSSQSVSVHLVIIAPGDFDHDGDVDQEDFGHFQQCLSGANAYSIGCEDADFNQDGHVEEGDAAVFLDCVDGPNRPPGC